jgi:hypothetical protein
MRACTRLRGMTMTGLREVLAAHGPDGLVSSRDGWVGCECGERLHLPSGLTFDGYAEAWDEERRARDAHLEAAVLAWVRDRLGDRALRDRAVAAAYEHANDNGMADHEEAAEAALSVVRADLSAEQPAQAHGDHRDDERPCRGINANVCVAEGCYGEACVRRERDERLSGPGMGGEG